MPSLHSNRKINASEPSPSRRANTWNGAPSDTKPYMPGTLHLGVRPEEGGEPCRGRDDVRPRLATERLVQPDERAIRGSGGHEIGDAEKRVGHGPAVVAEPLV